MKKSMQTCASQKTSRTCRRPKPTRSASKRKTKHKRLVTRTCSKTKRKANSVWKSSKTTPKYDSEDCGHRSRRRRPNKSYSNHTMQVSSDRNMLRTRKIERKERKNEKNARCNRNRNQAREQGLRKHELSWRERLQKIYEKCAHVTHGTKKKDHVICIATTRVENTTRERRHGDESRHAQGKAKKFQSPASFQRHILQK